MNKLKNFKWLIFVLFLLLLFLTPNIFAGDKPFNLPKLRLNDRSDQRLWIGDNWIKDSTNYFVMNQGLLVWDSLRVRRDLYVGELGGTIYLDTNKEISLSSQGYGLYLTNNKDYGSQFYYIGELNSAYYWFKSSGATSMPMMQLDTSSGLTVQKGGFTISTSTATLTTPSITIDNSATGKEVTGIGQLGALVATVTVSTSSVQDNSIIIITPREQIAGSFYVSNINSGTNFDVSSTDPTDTDKTFSWFIINLK